jgi:hypothetical protein
MLVAIGGCNATYLFQNHQLHWKTCDPITAAWIFHDVAQVLKQNILEQFVTVIVCAALAKNMRLKV